MILKNYYKWRYTENINHKITENICNDFVKRPCKILVEQLTYDIQYIICACIDEYEINDEIYTFRFDTTLSGDYVLRITMHEPNDNLITVAKYDLEELKEMAEYDIK